MDNLKKLLDKINLDKDNYSFFENGSLEKIILNNTKDSCNIILNLEDNLPLEIYEKTLILLKEYFKINVSLNIIAKKNNHK